MIKTYRLRNVLLTGVVTEESFEAELKKNEYYAALVDLVNDRVWMHSIAVNPVAMKTVASSTIAMEAIASSRTATAIVSASLTAINAIGVSPIAIAAVVGSLEIVEAVASSPTAMEAVLSSPTAMEAVLSSSTAMEAVLSSATAMGALFTSSLAKNAIWGSEVALTAIQNSSTATAWLRANNKVVSKSITGSGTVQIAGKSIALSFRQSHTPGASYPQVFGTLGGGSGSGNLSLTTLSPTTLSLVKAFTDFKVVTNGYGGTNYVELVDMN